MTTQWLFLVSLKCAFQTILFFPLVNGFKLICQHRPNLLILPICLLKAIPDKDMCVTFNVFFH